MNKWQRQTHDVEVISFDLRNIYTVVALNGIRTRLVVNVFAAYVLEDLPLSQRGKPNSRAFQTFESLFLRPVYYGHDRRAFGAFLWRLPRQQAFREFRCRR